MLVEPLLAAIIGGGLLGVIGVHMMRFQLMTISFTMAHAALAGGALGMLFGLDINLAAMILAITTGLLLGFIVAGREYLRETLSLTLFSTYSAVALLAIYYSNTRVLATTSLSQILWGSILTVTRSKLVLLAGTTILFTLYALAFRRHIDTIMFNPKLAEAEGIDTQLHTLVLVGFIGAAVSLMLTIIGGFLIFSLLYIPTLIAANTTSHAQKQVAMGGLSGALSATLGLTASYLLDTPVGVTITLTAATLLAITLPVSVIRSRRAGRKTTRML